MNAIKTFLVLILCIPILSCKEKQHWIVDSESGKIRLELVTDSITMPFAMEFLPDGRMVVSNRPAGEMILIDVSTGEKVYVRGVPAVINKGDGGLLDIKPDPDFANNHKLFFDYSFQDEHGFSLAVETAQLEGDSLVNRKRIFQARPYFDKPSFYGSRLLLQDDKIFITTGVDYSKQDSSQTLSNHLGKILRIGQDGSIPADNPFVNTPGALPEIWCYGTRNPQGLKFNPFTGELWENEHGPKGGDEINIIRPGKNYGWPVISYGIDYDDKPIGAGITEKEGMEQPVYYYVPSIAPSGMVFYTGDRYPQWKGNLFIGGMKLTHLNRTVIENGKVTHEERIMKEMKWRVRNIVQGPDGYLYVGVDGGRILKLVPEGK
jgi:glucose/arabinose dehydrogenase